MNASNTPRWSKGRNEYTRMNVDKHNKSDDTASTV